MAVFICQGDKEMLVPIFLIRLFISQLLLDDILPWNVLATFFDSNIWQLWTSLLKTSRKSHANLFSNYFTTAFSNDDEEVWSKFFFFLFLLNRSIYTEKPSAAERKHIDSFCKDGRKYISDNMKYPVSRKIRRSSRQSSSL